MISAARQSHRPEAFAVLSLKIRPQKREIRSLSPHCDARAVSGDGESEPWASAELSGHLSVTIQFLARQPATVARQSATVAEGWLGRR